MSDHITFAVYLMLNITNIIVLQQWLRFIFRAFQEFILLAFPVFYQKQRKAELLLAF